MKKLISMIALAAISLGAVSAAIPVKSSQDTSKMKDTTKKKKMKKMKKMKKDTTQKQ